MDLDFYPSLCSMIDFADTYLCIPDITEHDQKQNQYLLEFLKYELVKYQLRFIISTRAKGVLRPVDHH